MQQTYFHVDARLLSRERNEQADELVKQRSSTPYMGSLPVLGITKRMLRENIQH